MNLEDKFKTKADLYQYMTHQRKQCDFLTLIELVFALNI